MDKPVSYIIDECDRKNFYCININYFNKGDIITVNGSDETYEVLSDPLPWVNPDKGECFVYELYKPIKK